MLTRRFLLRGSALAMVGVGQAPMWLARAAATEGRKRKTLLAIFMRGAADGLNIVVPFGDPQYRERRPTIALAPPRGAVPSGVNGPFGSVIDLDGKFGLNGALQPLKPLWDKGHLAIVEATGSPDPSRSHFDAQDYMESGTPGQSTSDGWLNRSLTPVGPDTSPVRAVAMGTQLPRTLRGINSAIAVNDAQQFQMGNEEAAAVVANMYAATT